ncbi:unnamed protein product [Rotaria sp. Silwood2]|nr:unnamed protein product [Rotaria sp. Silwood2]CAF2813479.1 unnamed protein product [Rotaria sp. Silwood2]CAF3065187.1 unnamed protein product [Rotaria sp. Silwood2]CAF3183305.1 unnamed protein product [Rotaria sp. Silwood2]CAF3981431.1 unnamed protein product [Rotaria sp. Silwood2]
MYLSTNASVVYVTVTWTPQVNQIGSQKFCAIAYTSEQVQSKQYCMTFIVVNSTSLCTTTTTSTTTTTATLTITSTGSISTAVKLRQRFWGEKNARCDLCQRRRIHYSGMNNSQMSDEGSNQYRRQYVTDKPLTSTESWFRENSSVSDLSESFDRSSMTTTRTTLMSRCSITVIPSEDIPLKTKPYVPPPYPNPGGSILVRAYAKQQLPN